MGLYNGLQRGGVGGTLQAANGANKVANAFGQGNSTASGALGGANDAYGVYNAIAHPGVATGIVGAASALDAYNRVSQASQSGLDLASINAGNAASASKLAGGSSALGNAGTALGAAGDVMGIYNAFKNPTAGNVVSGAIDAYKLYGTVSSAFSSGGAAAGGAAAAGSGGSAAGASATAAGSSAGSALGAVAAPLAIAGAWIMLGNAITDNQHKDFPFETITKFAQGLDKSNPEIGAAVHQNVDWINKKFGSITEGNNGQKWTAWSKFQNWAQQNPTDPMAKIFFHDKWSDPQSKTANAIKGPATGRRFDDVNSRA